MINNLTSLLGEAQVNYRRLHFTDFVKELAPRPTTTQHKVQLPAYFKDLFPDDVSLGVVGVSGRKYAFWHAFLFAVYPKYEEIAWLQRKTMVDKFQEQLDQNLTLCLKSHPIMSRLNIKDGDIRFRDNKASDILLYYLCAVFDINIIIIDTVAPKFIYTGTRYNNKMPTIMLFRDDISVYYPISVDGQFLLPGDHDDLQGLNEISPDTNKVLESHVTKKDLELYAEVHGLDNVQQKKLQHGPQLNKLKLGELQALARQFSIDVKDSSTGRNKKKTTLIDEIIEASAN